MADINFIDILCLYMCLLFLSGGTLVSVTGSTHPRIEGLTPLWASTRVHRITIIIQEDQLTVYNNCLYSDYNNFYNYYYY